MSMVTCFFERACWHLEVLESPKQCRQIRPLNGALGVNEEKHVCGFLDKYTKISFVIACK